MALVLTSFRDSVGKGVGTEEGWECELVLALDGVNSWLEWYQTRNSSGWTQLLICLARLLLALRREKTPDGAALAIKDVSLLIKVSFA